MWREKGEEKKTLYLYVHGCIRNNGDIGSAAEIHKIGISLEMFISTMLTSLLYSLLFYPPPYTHIIY
jgi:hypothetical protein